MTAGDRSDNCGLDVFSDRYLLGDVVGLGGASTVYRAWDRHTDRPVALKLYREGIADTDRPPHRAEVAALARLRHPGLVALYDAGVDADRVYIAMQMIEGETLAQRIRNGPLSTAAVTAMGATLADTLSYVHARGIVHRDIKPANVLLDRHDRPFLTDFGVARLIDATHSTATGVVLGTPAFLAPEQVRGQHVGPAADVYTLGLVLLEAITGQREYPGGAVESAVARLHRPPQLPSHLPARLRTLLAAMTASDPAARPDAAQVASRLGICPPTQHTAGLSAEGGNSESRSRRRALGSLIAMAATAALGTVMLINPASTAPNSAPEARIGLQLEPAPQAGVPPIVFPPPIAAADQPAGEPADTPLVTEGRIAHPEIENRGADASPSPAGQATAVARLSIDEEPSTDNSSRADAEVNSNSSSHGADKSKGKGKGKGKGRDASKERGSDK
ncbi:MAG TPA: serine/threonine-protein kinase [Actinophytocola sp.]|nr:serine/threonine-protein kinase [Actinophytocola sp.]